MNRGTECNMDEETCPKILDGYVQSLLENENNYIDMYSYFYDKNKDNVDLIATFLEFLKGELLIRVKEAYSSGTVYGLSALGRQALETKREKYIGEFLEKYAKMSSPAP